MRFVFEKQYCMACEKILPVKLGALFYKCEFCELTHFFIVDAFMLNREDWHINNSLDSHLNFKFEKLNKGRM